MRRRATMTSSDARAILDAARTEALSRSLEVTIAIVDDAGTLLALERLDGARQHTPEAATLKARTASITRTATADLQAPVRDNPALLSFPGRMPLTGGRPIVWQGEVVGGIGSSGGQPDEDEAVCRAGLAAFDTGAGNPG